MGRLIVPLGVILYIAFSVIGAVIKAINNPPAQPSKYPVASLEKISLEIPDKPSKTLYDTEEDSHIQRSYQVSQEDDWLDLKTTKDSKTVAIGENVNLVSSNLASKMREGFIMSEIIREPRSRRPWPNR